MNDQNAFDPNQLKQVEPQEKPSYPEIHNKSFAQIAATESKKEKNLTRGQKFMIWGADWLGKNVKGKEEPLGLKHIEGQNTWAVRPAAATWIRNQMQKGTNRIVIVANKSAKGLDTNPTFHKFVLNDIAKKGERGRAVVSKAEKKFPKDPAKAVAYAIKKSGGTIEKYRALASESEGFKNAGKTMYVATVNSLSEDNKHPSYPVKVFLSDVREIQNKMPLEQAIPGDKYAHLKMRSNNLTAQPKGEFAKSIEGAKPLEETLIQRNVGITPATVNQANPKAFLQTKKYKELWNLGDYQGANAIKSQLLSQGQQELQSHFAQYPDIQITAEPSSSNYFGESEPTLVVSATMPKTQEGNFFRGIAEQSQEWGQDTVHISEILPSVPENAILGKEFADGFVFEPNIDFRFTRALTDPEQKLISEKIQSLGLAGDTIHPDGMGINLYNISKFKSYEQFLKEVKKIEETLKKLNLGGVSGSGKASGLGISSESSIRRLLVIGNPESGATRTYKQIAGFVSPAERPQEEFVKGKVNEIYTKLPDTQPLRGMEEYTIGDVKNIVKDTLKGFNRINSPVKILDIEVIGSRAMGTPKPDSDIDVLVQYKGNIKEQNFRDILAQTQYLTNVGDVGVSIIPTKESIGSWLKSSAKSLAKYGGKQHQPGLVAYNEEASPQEEFVKTIK